MDSVLLSLVNRALNALKSLVILSESQYAADANVLARVIVEIWIVVRWVTNKDSFNRARKFTQFEAKGIERTMGVLRTHDPTVLIPQNPNQEIITEAARLYSSHVYWAGTTKSMAEEAEEIDNSFTDLIYFYEVPYFMMSWYVHSNMMGVRALFPDLKAPFRVKPGLDPGLCEMAVVVASNCVTLTAMRISDVLGLNLSAQVRAAWLAQIAPLLQE